MVITMIVTTKTKMKTTMPGLSYLKTATGRMPENQKVEGPQLFHRVGALFCFVVYQTGSPTGRSRRLSEEAPFYISTSEAENTW